MKIAIVGLIGSENLGEKFIAKSLTWLIRDKLSKTGFAENVNFVAVDLEGKKNITIPAHGFINNRLKNYEYYSRVGIIGEIVYLCLKRIVHKIKNRRLKEILHKIRHSIWMHSLNLKRRSLRYYNEKLSDVDFIVVDGAGLLEYSKNEYHEYLNTLCEYAENKHIPVVFNAIGRSGEFDKTDFRCKILMQSFKRKCVKYVSARDSVEDVQKCVTNRFSVKLRADAAFWFDKAYGLEKNNKSNVIGIGLIRGNSMQAYGIDFKEDDWINLYVGIAKELESRKERYQFFTNGYPADYYVGKKVIEKLGKSDDYLVVRPIDDKVLARTISSYSGLITCRMHSSIAAFTLGIPSVVLSWNPKINKYMDIIGYPERSINLNDFDPKTIVERFIQAREEGLSPDSIEKMKHMASASVDGYLSLLCAGSQRSIYGKVHKKGLR